MASRYTASTDFNTFCEQLWNSDQNRLVPDKDYVLDLQGQVNYYSSEDRAAGPLFVRVNSEVLKRPINKAFVALLDNYESDTGIAETVTAQEETENWNFINLVFASKPFQLAYTFLRNRGKISNEAKFKQKLYDMWFKLYRRSSENDSSGFEHVFVGETRWNKVLGFHNWIQFYLQEKNGNINYKGFISGEKNPHLVTIKFSWKDQIKAVGSAFVGVSPEFEIALYSVCYLMGEETYPVTLGGEPVIICCYSQAGNLMACYPKMR